MSKGSGLLFAILISTGINAQKKPLDHSVYDGWQSVGERMISNDGKWVAYSIDLQEGDGSLVIKSTAGDYTHTVSRGYDAVMSEDSRFIVFKIKPFFKDSRDARIKKKRPEEMPKDSLGILELGKDSVVKVSRVKSFKMPAKSFGWLAYQSEKPVDASAKPKGVDRRIDSMARVIDSLKAQLAAGQEKRRKLPEDDLVDYPGLDADGDEPGSTANETGSDLTLLRLGSRQQQLFHNVLEFMFSKNGMKLLVEESRNAKDSLSLPYVILYNLRMGLADTLSRGGNDFKNFSLSDDGMQVAYVAERDAKPKDLQKFYRLWYFKEGMDSAHLAVDKNSVGMMIGMTVSEFGVTSFSRSGDRLFFGTAPIRPPKDTTVPEIDQVKLDIWHYNDDYLQTVQLNRLQRDLQENFLAVYQPATASVRQIGSKELPTIYQTDEGDGKIFYGITDFGRRIASQWTGNTLKDIYAIDMATGAHRLVKKDMNGVINASYVSPSGKFIAWYDFKAKNYFCFDGDSTRNISARIKTILFNEENDSPTDPFPYGIMGWAEGDSSLFLYDRYDVWSVSPSAGRAPKLLFDAMKARVRKAMLRYVKTNPEERFISAGQDIAFRVFFEQSKLTTFFLSVLNSQSPPVAITTDQMRFNNLYKAGDARVYLYSKETFVKPADVYIKDVAGNGKELRLSNIDPQQQDYNWGTAELYKWKTFTGKSSEGILYKPEDFDPSKKYPLILYFYEKLSNELYDYKAPAPTPSRLNITFFVSRGYLVFAPDITYTIGHPARSAYDYIVSAAKDLAKHSWVDAANMAIQGQSWGGIQVAQLVTRTDIFKAAWAGAPVANMTSAYGGIRWESGLNRQFQYERTQSRIGATIWEKPELYIESSPLFHLPAVKTPLVIMSNDADGAVPWYQGIELFTGMRRLGKKVWLLNYNGEAHNLVQRRNRKDIQVREQEYFDWMLKGVPPPKWITEGIPAVLKGREWGL